MMSIIEVKEQATILKEFLKQKNSEIALSSCLQAIAKINRFKDWNTMSAVLKKHEVKHEADKSKETNSSTHVLISELALSIIVKLEQEDKFNADTHALLNFFLSKLLNNSMYVLFRFEYLKELGATWSRYRFSSAINQLLHAKFIDVNSAGDGEMIYINPSFFWKGNAEANVKAINDYDDRYAVMNMGCDEADIKTVSYTGFYGESRFETEGSLDFYSELRNQSKFYPKKVPELFFSDVINADKHPEILKLQNVMKKEKAISDPRIYYSRIKKALEGKYYVGSGGAHIHIKSLDGLTEIAYIVGGIG